MLQFHISSDRVVYHILKAVGILAHESAMQGGKILALPDFKNA
jgi:hypothetical protein